MGNDARSNFFHCLLCSLNATFSPVAFNRPVFFLQTCGSPGGASGLAAAAVAGRWTVCGCEVWSAADLLHPAAAPPCSGRHWHTRCQVSNICVLKTLLFSWIAFSLLKLIIHQPSLKPGVSCLFLCFRSEVEVAGVVVSMVHCSQTGTVALQLEDGQIKKLLYGQLSTLFYCCWIMCSSFNPNKCFLGNLFSQIFNF